MDLWDARGRQTWPRVRLHFGTARRRENRRRRKVEKEKGAKNTKRNRERRFPIWSIRHVQSGASCIVPLVHSYPALFPYRCSFILPPCNTRFSLRPPPFRFLYSLALSFLFFSNRFRFLFFAKQPIDLTEFCLYFNTNAIPFYRKSTMKE